MKITSSLWLLTSMALATIPGSLAQIHEEENQNYEGLVDGDVIGLFNRIPECAKRCSSMAITSTGCDLQDSACICNSGIFSHVGSDCIRNDCSVWETIRIMNATTDVCNLPIRDKSTVYKVATGSVAILASLFVVQRIAYKIYAKLSFEVDDWFTIIAFLLSIPNSVINGEGLPDSGVGHDIWVLTSDNILWFGRYFYATIMVYYLEISLIKIALLFFYMRIFPSVNVRRLIWATIAFISVWGSLFILVSAFQCNPIYYAWHMWDGEHVGQCINLNALIWAHAGLSIALDIWMLALPLWQVRRLQLDWKKKMGVALMFCVGTFVTIVSILRLQSLVKYNAKIFNPTWDFFAVGIWSTVEIHVGIICICLPSLRLFLVHLFPRLLGTGSYFSHPSHTGGYGASSHGKSRGNISRVERTQLGHDDGVGEEVLGNRIAVNTTYTVDYGDETELVHMDMDKKSAISERGSNLARSDMS